MYREHPPQNGLDGERWHLAPLLAFPFAWAPGDSDAPEHVTYRRLLWREFQRWQNVCPDPWAAPPGVIVERSAGVANALRRFVAGYVPGGTLCRAHPKYRPYVDGPWPWRMPRARCGACYALWSHSRGGRLGNV